MGTALAVPQGLGADIEKVLIGGDLSPLNSEQRLRYYNAVCTSIGLNQLTRPFEYIVLNGKLQLYARKDCTEQLRKIHGVSITSVDPKQIGNLFVVVAAAQDREGRTDSGTGAVNMANLTGENLANAMMKAETKAKRRVTLSLCGLGMLDETEVQTLREQGVASEPQGNTWQTPTQQTDPSPILDSSAEPNILPRSQKGTSQAQQTQQQPVEPRQQAPQGQVVDPEPSITAPRSKRLFAIARSAGLSEEQMKQRLASIGLHCHRDSIPKSRYCEAVDVMDPEFRFHQREA